MNTKSILVLDTETIGLDKNSRIIEISTLDHNLSPHENPNPQHSLPVKTANNRRGSSTGFSGGGYRCPDCGGKLVQRSGSKGVFWGCKNYPKCKYTEPDAHGEPRFAATERNQGRR